MIYFSMPYRAYDVIISDKELKRKVFALGHPQRSNKWRLYTDDWVPAKYKAQAAKLLEELKEAYYANKH